MVDMAAIVGAANALKTAYELSKAALGLRDASLVRAKITEMQGEISSALASAITAQTEQMTMLERVRDLEKQIADLKNWETEKQRYELKQVSFLGSTAYVVKPEAKGSEPPHCICAACYQNAKKRVLQPTMVVESGRRVWQCPECKNAVSVTPPLPGYTTGA